MNIRRKFSVLWVIRLAGYRKEAWFNKEYLCLMAAWEYSGIGYLFDTK